ncbi:hypothetical protein B0H14DRAFT_2625822 [Mycena olivaceomarginata]|nr:hypothetical protein B0H14DRAFT_2625822 [Mycena olivaceomarginata]
MAGISSHLVSLGVKKVDPKKPKDCTELDIDHSMYLLPTYLFPVLQRSSTPYDANFTDLDLGLELVGIEYDPRSIILNLSTCFLEIEPLLHTSPQFFSNEEWKHVARIPAKQRGFKVVIALQLKTHTVAFLSMDNLCYVYWFSCADIDAARPGRVPDVILDHWKWSEYTVQWLKEQDMNPKWDRHSFAEVLSMPGSHPLRGVGRYSEDEISARSGVPLWTLWRDVRLNPKLLCAVLETFFLFVMERYCAIPEFLATSRTLNKLCGKDSEDTDSSSLIISTKESVLQYSRMLSVHKREWCHMSQRKKQLVLQYNISLLPFSYSDTLDQSSPIIGTQFTLRKLFRPQPKKCEIYTTNYQSLSQKKQRLSLKPMVDLSDDEKSFLLATYGSTTNPIVRYFQAKSTTFLSNHRPPKVHTPPLPLPLSPIDIELLAKEIFEGELPLLSDDESDDDFQDEDGSLGDGLDDFEVSIIQGTLDADIVDEEEEEDSLPAISESQLTDADEQAVGNAIDSVDEDKRDEPLSLIRDGPKFGSKCPTILCKSHTPSAFYTWTVLKPPYSSTHPNQHHNPPNALVYSEVSNDVRLKRTLKAIKENMRLYTVGPLDFCGHAKAIQLGRGCMSRVIALCQWDSTLSVEDQLFMRRSWESIGTWRKGIRKYPKAGMRREMAFRAKVRKLLKDSWTLVREIQEADIDREVARQRKIKRDSDLQKQLEKIARDERKSKSKSKRKVVSVSYNADDEQMALIEDEFPVASSSRRVSARLSACNSISSASTLLGITRRGPRKSKTL